ncbi:myb/SANT-like DNA-binding domain-containing protein 3 [Asterias rubens]|uniref:myb/SANT-like DNA-binding domain-containing protein 3 n=1 Tax=Asterias rubens TaxID=7604 RepID=UPI00145584B1|nr:myb/SANT-like DNA-binding domain-containing protein 3 [Asterias rubens]
MQSYTTHTARNTAQTFMMSTKRLHFSILERNFLLRLLEENIDIVESKCNDGITMRRKDETWARIVSRFNAEPSVVKRTPRQLRKCWTNMKMRAKKSDGSSSLPGLVARHTPQKHETREGPVSVRLQPDSDQMGVKYDSVFSGSGESGADSANGTDVKMIPVECWSDNEVDGSYSGLGGGSEDEDGDEGSYHQQDVEERARADFHTSETDFRHETAADSNNSQWTGMDYTRNEHEAKMSLLTIQMETAHEQRELAREMREQTRQRHRLEMQVLEEKRRYRRMKMNRMSSQGKS